MFDNSHQAGGTAIQDLTPGADFYLAGAWNVVRAVDTTRDPAKVLLRYTVRTGPQRGERKRWELPARSKVIGG